MDTFDDFKKKFMINDLSYISTEYWTVSVRPHHPTIGSSIISLNRPCDSIANISPEEAKDFVLVCKKVEGKLKELFDYSKINYLLLMMFDPYVHYHVIPRYESPVKIGEQVWQDETFPALPPLLGEAPSEEVLQSIRAQLS